MKFDNIEIKGFGFIKSIMLFSAASALLLLETRFLIPYLSNITGCEIIIFWFIVGGLGIFLPLLIISVLIIKSEGYRFNKNLWENRLRFKKLNRNDWLWCLGAIIIIGIMCAAIVKIIVIFAGDVNFHPPFMEFEPLTKNRYWILLIWFPYWILNIMGEEILWRGTILPRQEIVFGRFTWLLHGIFWGIFHIGFGWQLLLILLPIFFVQSYVVQKRKNSWTGVIIHAGINGPNFIAISLGLI